MTMMDKDVLISIRPNWCDKIASGVKTLEIRKTRPKLETPFKCYIYQTMTGYVSKSKENDILVPIAYGKVIGEFVCDRIVNVDCDSVAPFDKETGDYINELCCLGRNELWEYTHGRCAYGWHISDLVIYNRPKELSEFSSHNSVLEFDGNGRLKYSGLKRPPQSWCYLTR